MARIDAKCSTGWCVEVHDLAISKYAANREKDREFVRALVRHALVVGRKSGATIDSDDSGIVKIAAVSGEAGARAREMIEAIVKDPEVGRIYEGPVKNTTTFGAFVEIMPGTDGLLHVSEIANHRVKDVRDELKEGEQILVKVINIDPTGKIRRFKIDKRRFRAATL